MPGGAVLPAESGRLKEHAHKWKYIFCCRIWFGGTYMHLLAKKELNKEAKPTQLPADQAQSWEIIKDKKI